MFIININELQNSFDTILQKLPRGRRERTTAFRPEEGRLHSAAAGLLLAEALSIDEDRDTYRDRSGKPLLVRAKGDLRYISVSHGGAYAAAAGGAEPLGIDVERIGPYHVSIVRRCFRPDEREWVLEKDSDERFFAVWTMKESIMKADGRGLGLNPKDFSVFDTEWKTVCGIYDGHMFAAASRSGGDLELIRVVYRDGSLRETERIVLPEGVSGK